ncbi:hypothetical protein RV02_GL003454 [Enterococcus gilvus]|nr:hypothetical protein RV02_GL003454 [Enterococcus gilvus]
MSLGMPFFYSSALQHLREQRISFVDFRVFKKFQTISFYISK